MIKNRSKPIMVLCIMFLLFACSLSVIIRCEVSNATVLNISKKTLLKGQKFKLKAYLAKGKVTWISKNKKVATVNKSGKVTAKRKGSTKIIAKNLNGNTSCKIIVQEPKLNKTKLSLKLNSSYTLKLRGTNETVTWGSSNSKVVSVYDGKLEALNVGTSTITAKVLNKKFKCKVTVSEDTSPGSRLSPLYPYQPYTTDVYDGSTYLGKFTIELLDYKDGSVALNYVSKNEFNPIPGSEQEYIYLKFKLNYLTGTGGTPVSAYDILNPNANLFDSSGTRNIDSIDWAFNFESIKDMIDVTLYPGGIAECSKAILIDGGNTPITYRIQTGYNETTYKPIYTWFSVEK